MRRDKKDTDGLNKVKYRKAESLVRKAVRNGTIHTEKEAEALVRTVFPRCKSYKVTLLIHPLLPQKVKTVHRRGRSTHPWFKRKVRHALVEDIWGRFWSVSIGTVKPGVKLVKRPKMKRFIDGLGGMSWDETRHGSMRFVCCYRSSIEEHDSARPKPQTFLQ